MISRAPLDVQLLLTSYSDCDIDLAARFISAGRWAHRAQVTYDNRLSRFCQDDPTCPYRMVRSSWTSYRRAERRAGALWHQLLHRVSVDRAALLVACMGVTLSSNSKGRKINQ